MGVVSLGRGVDIFKQKTAGKPAAFYASLELALRQGQKVVFASSVGTGANVRLAAIRFDNLNPSNCSTHANEKAVSLRLNATNDFFACVNRAVVLHVSDMLHLTKTVRLADCHNLMLLHKSMFAQTWHFIIWLVPCTLEIQGLCPAPVESTTLPRRVSTKGGYP